MHRGWLRNLRRGRELNCRGRKLYFGILGRRTRIGCVMDEWGDRSDGSTLGRYIVASGGSFDILVDPIEGQGV
jgi:hypothetical protein